MMEQAPSHLSNDFIILVSSMGVDVSAKFNINITTNFTQNDIPWQDGRFLYNLWQQKSYDNKLPARSDFIPLELKTILPNIMLLDVKQEPLNVSMRLVGSFITNIVKSDPTGKNFQDVLERFQWLVKNKKPYFIAKAVPEWAPVDYRDYNILALPLAEDGENVDMAMVLVSPYDYET